MLALPVYAAMAQSDAASAEVVDSLEDAAAAIVGESDAGLAEADAADSPEPDTSAANDTLPTDTAGAATPKRIFRALKRYAVHLIVLIMSAVVIALAAAVLFRRRERERFLTSTRLSIVDKEVRRACNYIENNYADPDLGVDTMCEELTTGPAFLQALFHNELGMSVEEFIEQVRMNRARIALGNDPAVSSGDLASMVGYTDTNALSRDFMRITGITLDDYRANV
ncbi:MAG: helix-turn-helix domain-containing protein [Chitinivibrionales bacterium]|nr:helix-turn-helix domain-containing protein [Chitinivibrionales bacterium]